MARLPHKMRIVELPDGKFCFTPIVQSTPRRSREFATEAEAMAYLWSLITTSDENYSVEFEPANIVEPPKV